MIYFFHDFFTLFYSRKTVIMTRVKHQRHSNSKKKQTTEVQHRALYVFYNHIYNEFITVIEMRCEKKAW